MCRRQWYSSATVEPSRPGETLYLMLVLSKEGMMDCCFFYLCVFNCGRSCIIERSLNSFYSSIVLTVFILLWNILELFLLHNLNSVLIRRQHPISQSPQPLAATVLLSVSVNVTTSDILDKWNHAECIFL